MDILVLMAVEASARMEKNSWCASFARFASDEAI